MSTVSARAPGKLILLGEHAVVHGHAALAGAVDRGTTVTLRDRPGPTGLAGGEADPLLAEVLRQALPAEGVEVEIASDLPLGRGMGSSAALTVALVRAAAARVGQRLDPEAQVARSLALERVFHGRPSGIDSTVVVRGGLLRFRRGPPLEVQPVPVARPLPLVVLDSGVPGSTARMVAAVAARRPAVDSLLSRLGDLADAAPAHLDDLAALGALLDEAHAVLSRLGVSTPVLDGLAALARDHGARGAKLSGAGGGGVVLALVPPDQRSAVVAAAKDAGYDAFPVDLPAAGGPR